MADFVIIGGGVYGAGVAWALARQGAGVHLIEKHGIASGASGGPGRRAIRANGRDPRELPLMRLAYDLWPSLHAELGAPQFYERCGHLWLFENEANQVQLFEDEASQARAKAQVWLQERHGIRSELLNAAQVREREPRIANTIVGAIHCPDDGLADQGATARAYARAAEALGATVQEGVSAAALETAQGRVTGVITSNEGRIPVGRGLLVLANSAVADLVRPWVTLPVWNETWQVLVSAPLESVPFSHVLLHPGRTLHLKTEGADRIMIAGGWPAQWDEALAKGRLLESSIAGNLADAVAVFPELEGITAEITDASHQEALSIDSLPVIDRLPGAENALYATGWSGQGMAIAPVVADLLAEWALTEERPALLAPFALSRFGRGAR